MKHLLTILSFLLLSSPLFAQSKRPETIIIPVSGIDDVTNSRKLILQNTLEDELKSHFRLVPHEKYQEVLEKVIEELEFEECNEDTYIMRVQEMLQVENVFHLQVISEGKDAQLSVGWSGTILTSSDGTTWTERTSGTPERLYGVTYGNGLS